MTQKIVDYDVVVCSFKKMKKNGKIIHKRIKFCDYTTTNDAFIAFLHKKDLFNDVWNKIYRKDILFEYNIFFDTNISIGEDLEFNLKYFKNAKKIYYINESLYTYRLRANGLNYRYHEDRIIIRKSLYEYEKKIFSDNHFDEKLIFNEYIKICLAQLKQLNYLKNKEIKEEIEKILYDNDRKKELNKIKKNGNFKQFILVKLLSYKSTMVIICNLIKLLKK